VIGEIRDCRFQRRKKSEGDQNEKEERKTWDEKERWNIRQIR
jgi:hypothetical protein